MPTVYTGSRPSSRSPVRSSPRWSIVFSSANQNGRPTRLSQVGRAGWLNGLRRRWRRLDASRNLVRETNLGIEPGAGPGTAVLGHRIAGGQAKLGAVALGPLGVS